MCASEPALGKYIYGIIRCPEPREFPIRGIAGVDLVHTVHFDDLAAVVSDSPVIEYENSRRNMMAHTGVLEEVMRDFTVLPVRFSVIAPDETAIREQVLKRRYKELDYLLRKMNDQVELGLKAFWNEETVLQEILAEHAVVRQLRDSLMGRPAEETYYERIRLGELIEAALNRKRDEDARHILNRVRSLATDVRMNKIFTDRMVLNAAFLVNRQREAEFDQAVQQLDAEMGNRLTFKYVGSVPPYNFVNITVKWDA